MRFLGLRKSDSPRIINISSAIHAWGKIDLQDLQYTRRHYGPMKAYAQSKLLMNITTFELARRLEALGIVVNCLHPGAVKTNLGMAEANNLFLKIFVKTLKCFFVTSQKAAAFPVLLANSSAFGAVSGKYFSKGKDVQASELCYDQAFAKKLWEISTNMLNIA